MRKFKLLLLIYILSLTHTIYATNSLPWPTQVNSANPTPYFYYFDKDTLQTSVTKIAQSFDIKVHFASDIPINALNQKISGRFKVSSPSELLDRFANMYAFTWFYYSGILYIASKNFITKNLYVAEDMLGNFKDILNDDGILDSRFGWSEIPSQGMIVISGPKDYINLITQKMKDLDIAPIDQQFQIFHLKYANAVDTTIQLSNNQIVIPGVASILQAMLQNQQNLNPAIDNKLMQQVIEPLKNSLNTIADNKNILNPQANINKDTKDSPNQAEQSNGKRTKSSISTPIIQADVRLNTIIIRDKSSNMPVYKALIDILDVPAPLIQVEVLMVDIDQLRMNEAGISWWGNTTQNIHGGFGSNNLVNNPQPGTPTLSASFGNISPGNLIVNNIQNFISGLKFMENKGYAKTQAKTAVVTIDNIPAVVNLTESFFTINGQNPQGIQLQTTTQMQVIPHLIYEGKNQKRLKLTVSLQDGNVEEKMVNGLPVTLQGNLNSQAIIEEGNSLLLAGFSHKKSEQIESKVPILGDIPIIGWFFSQKSISNKSFQRSYLVSPTVIWSDRTVKIPNYSILNKINDKKSSSKSK